MLILQKATQLDQIEFNHLYNRSINAHDEIEYLERQKNISATGQDFTERELRKKSFNTFNEVLINDLETDFLIEIREDGNIIGLATCQLESAYDNSLYENQYRIGAFLGCNDSSGNKHWLFGEEYYQARNAFWSSIGISGWKEIYNSWDSPLVRITKSLLPKIQRYCNVEIYEDRYKYNINDITEQEAAVVESMPNPIVIKYSNLEE